jgi:GNAT superfamily N-acetyltransferase
MKSKLPILLRPVEKSDLDSTFELLQSISEFLPAKNEYSDIWDMYKNQQNFYAIVAAVDKKIIGFGSICIETKIRGGSMGHIEDIVTNQKYRKKGIGTIILNGLCDIAKANNCYKVSLQCKEENLEFYNKANFEIGGFSMQKFID